MMTHFGRFVRRYLGIGGYQYHRFPKLSLWETWKQTRPLAPIDRTPEGKAWRHSLSYRSGAAKFLSLGAMYGMGASGKTWVFHFDVDVTLLGVNVRARSINEARDLLGDMTVYDLVERARYGTSEPKITYREISPDNQVVIYKP